MPPGPRLPRVAQTAMMISRQNSFLHACHRRYGDCFTVRVSGQAPLVYVVDPKLVREVFTGDMNIFHAGESNAMLGPVLGKNSLLLLDEDDAVRSRQLMQPPFHGNAVRRQIDEMTRIAVAEMAGWPVGRPFPLLPRMQAITLEVILRSVIGAHQQEHLDELRAAVRPLVEVHGILLLGMIQQRLLRFRPWSNLIRAREHAIACLLRHIARTRADPALEQRFDVLSMLIRAGHTSDDELCDQLITLLIAGHETTATALAWAFERLTRNPDALARATRAADEHDESYLEALVMESLRMRPVFPDVARKITREIELGGYRLPAGTLVAPSITLLHNDDRYYPEAAEFRPERFIGRGMGS
ncbi:MAG TPA: cytochrome P450, partial [Actinophytocola sp.]|uniref:cytochrome P450 n=1 Tax=Actinophytocola sp. TaxID=1872138 RepID=UPI002E04F205|nr:cytochrome P450 [Actinophytocola sp.]